MDKRDAVDFELLELLSHFENHKTRLLNKPAFGQPNMVFGDIAVLNPTEPNLREGSFIGVREVRTEIPQVFTWILKKFTPILAKLPDYGLLKEEIFGRLGNTIVLGENVEPKLTSDEKIAALFQDFYEITHEIIDGTFRSMAVARDNRILDDVVTRSLKSGFVDQETFLRVALGEVN